MICLDDYAPESQSHAVQLLVEEIRLLTDDEWPDAIDEAVCELMDYNPDLTYDEAEELIEQSL